jgi:NADH dehydrogenase
MTIRRVTVFGASGFIGRYVVKRLGQRGLVVAAATRDPDRAGVLRPMGDVGQIAPIRADVTSEPEARAAMTGADAVVNLVGILYEGGGQRFEAVHAEAAGRIGRLAKELGVARVVHVSALGADAGSGALYARSKAEGEQRLRGGFPGATIHRPSVVFGPEDDFFNRFAAMVRGFPILPLIGGGGTRFQPVYVGDVADALVKTLLEEGHAGRTYELGGPRVYTMRELFELLEAELGRRRPMMSLPWGLARLQARFLELLPVPPLTRDQVELLKRDNVVSAGAPGLAELGIAPTAVEVVLPTYMDRFRKGGWFTAHGMEKPNG